VPVLDEGNPAAGNTRKGRRAAALTCVFILLLLVLVGVGLPWLLMTPRTVALPGGVNYTLFFFKGNPEYTKGTTYRATGRPDQMEIWKIKLGTHWLIINRFRKL